MRPKIVDLINLGTLPSEKGADVEKIRLIEETLAKIKPPITNEEAEALVKLFGEDSCFGLAWTLLHLVETAPDWPIEECLKENKTNPWMIRLRRSADNKIHLKHD